MRSINPVSPYGERSARLFHAKDAKIQVDSPTSFVLSWSKHWSSRSSGRKENMRAAIAFFLFLLSPFYEIFWRNISKEVRAQRSTGTGYCLSPKPPQQAVETEAACGLSMIK